MLFCNKKIVLLFYKIFYILFCLFTCEIKLNVNFYTEFIAKANEKTFNEVVKRNANKK